MANLSKISETTSVFTQNTQEKVIIKIIADHIVYTRIYDGMHTVLNAYDPNHDDYELKPKYSGIDTALLLMSIEDEKLIEKLHDAYYNGVFGKYSMLSAPELAKIIYVEWLHEIKNYFLTKKVA